MLKLFVSFSHAFRGIYDLLRYELHAQIEFVLAILSVGLGLYLHISEMEWCFVFLSIGGVLAAEGFNTAIERVCDFQTMEWREEIRYIKDVAAGCVLIMGIMVICVGVVIFGPKIIHLL